MAVDKEVIFIVGCPRSGSTFLNNILREYLDIGFANELQLIPKWYKKARRYGDLRIKSNLFALIDDILQEPYFKIFELTYSKGLGRKVRITKEQLIENIPESSLSGVLYGILKTTAVQLGKNRVGNKHLSMALHLDWLDELFPKCKVIHIIRDGRDCTLSLKRMRWGHSNAYAAARLWSNTIRLARSYGTNVLRSRYIEVKYEDLLKDIVCEMGRLASFLEGKNIDASALSDRFGDLRYQVKQGNIQKWKTSMDVRDVKIFQGVAKNELRECGYEVVPGAIYLRPWSKFYYRMISFVYAKYKMKFRKDMPA